MRGVLNESKQGKIDVLPLKDIKRIKYWQNDDTDSQSYRGILVGAEN